MFNSNEKIGEIHVPRTGGTGRHEAISNHIGLTEGGWHWTAAKAAQEIDNFSSCFTWSFRRDPKEVVLSTFLYRQKKLEEPNIHIIPKEIEFKEWLTRFVGRKVGPEKTQFARGLEITTHLPYWFKRNQCLVSLIFNFHKMEEALDHLSSRLGLDIEWQDMNGTGLKNIEDFYDGECHDIVESRFSEDYALLGDPRKADVFSVYN